MKFYAMHYPGHHSIGINICFDCEFFKIELYFVTIEIVWDKDE